MFSRSTHKCVDILLERKCTAVSENNGSCLFVCKTTVVLISNPDSMLHWSCSYSLHQHKPLLLDPFFKLRPKLKNNSGSALYTSVWKTWCSSWAEVQQEMKLTFFLQHPRIAGEEASPFATNIDEWGTLHSESNGSLQLITEQQMTL